MDIIDMDRDMEIDWEVDMDIDMDRDMNVKGIKGYVCDGINDNVTRMNTREWIHEVASWSVVSENENEKQPVAAQWSPT